MEFSWNDVELRNLDFKTSEKLINELIIENSPAKFDYYYSAVKIAINNSTNLNSSEKSLLAQYLVNVYSDIEEAYKRPSINMLSAFHYYLDYVGSDNKRMVDLLEKFGVGEVKKLRSLCAKFYNDLTNEKISVMILLHCKSIIKTDCSNKALEVHLTKDITYSKNMLRSLYTGGLIDEIGLKFLMDDFNKFLDLMVN